MTATTVPSVTADAFIEDAQDADNVRLFSKQNKEPLSLTVDALSYTIPSSATSGGIQMPACFRRNAGKNQSTGGLDEAEIKFPPPGESTILENVSFSVDPGRFLCIMGGSGSGKTSLLDAITGYATTGRIMQGVGLDPQAVPVRIGGLPITETLQRRYVGYVTQDDRLLPNLTVRETLMYVALLRLPSHLSQMEKMDRVDAVIGEVGLSHVANSKIGGEAFKGISGGERRRVSIASQLIVDPSILLLDEPTTGLDSNTAHGIVVTLRNIARTSSRTVVCTIHQPRSEVFQIMDLILLLSKGEVCYFGDKESIIPYFSSINFHCPPLANPSEYFLDLTTVDYRDEEREKDTSATIDVLIKAYKDRIREETTKRAAQSTESCGEGVVNKRRKSSFFTPNQEKPIQGLVLCADILLERFRKPIGRWEQFSLLYMRATRNIVQDMGGFVVKCFESAFMGFVIGLIFWMLGNDQNSIRDRFGLFFIVCTLYCFNLILGFIVRFNEQRPSFYRERRDACYDLLPYFASQFFSELPFVSVVVVLYSLPMFYMADLNTNNGGFGLFLVTVFCVVYASRSYALVAVSLFADQKKAVYFANLLFSLFVFSGGFIFNLDSLLPVVKWIASFCFIRRGVEALSINEFEGLIFTCDSTNVTECILTGEQALEVYNMNSESFAVNILILVANIVGCRIVSFFALEFIDQRPVQ
eukprot:Nk52_evm5s211 gene=Nk52_evmTU5s211